MLSEDFWCKILLKWIDQNEGPLIPQHTRQASMAALGLLFYSILMFTLPFLAFFGVQRILRDYFDIDGFINTGWSVLAVVVTVNAIIIAYAYKAYHEPEYDDEGNEIKDEDTKKED